MSRLDVYKRQAFIPSALTCAREQDVEKITQTALSVIETLFERYPDIHSIGVTGQMHGILYVDADGNAVSPLYTWQDARGSLDVYKRQQHGFRLVFSLLLYLRETRISIPPTGLRHFSAGFQSNTAPDCPCRYARSCSARPRCRRSSGLRYAA